MTAYYNEIEPYPAAWLRNLIKEGLIPDGEVDTRSIIDVRPADLAGFEQCHFFAGLGGWCRALRVAGFPDDRPVWTGSCPCQPFSLAGKQKGFADERHLWPVWRELIRERRPPKVYGEQVASAAQWLGLVRSDLEAMEYAVGVMPVEAASAGADHLRDRYWFVADSKCGAGDRRSDEQERQPQGRVAADRVGQVGVSMAHADAAGSQGWQLLPECAGERVVGADGVADAKEQRRQAGNAGSFPGTAVGERSPQQLERCCGDADARLSWVIGADGKARRVKPGLRLLVDGVPNRVAKLRALGNAIDPRPAAAFIRATM